MVVPGVAATGVVADWAGGVAPADSPASHMADFLASSAVSRSSRIGSSSTDFISLWNPVVIFLNSA